MKSVGSELVADLRFEIRAVGRGKQICRLDLDELVGCTGS